MCERQAVMNSTPFPKEQGPSITCLVTVSPSWWLNWSLWANKGNPSPPIHRWWYPMREEGKQPQQLLTQLAPRSTFNYSAIRLDSFVISSSCWTIKVNAAFYQATKFSLDTSCFSPSEKISKRGHWSDWQVLLPGLPLLRCLLNWAPSWMNSEQKCKAWRNSTPFSPQRLTTAYAAAYYSLCLPVFHCIYSRGNLI